MKLIRAWFFAPALCALLLIAACHAPKRASSADQNTTEQPSNPLAGLVDADPSTLDLPMRKLAIQQLDAIVEPIAADLRFRLLMLAGRYDQALQAISEVRRERAATAGASVLFMQHEVWVRAQKRLEDRRAASAEGAFAAAFAEVITPLDDVNAALALGSFQSDVSVLQSQVSAALQQASGSELPDANTLSNLLRQFQVYRVYRDLLPHTQALIADDDSRRYVVKDDVLIRTPSGVTLSAMLMYKAKQSPQAALLTLNIYTDYFRLRSNVREMAARGYAGVVLDARGKRLSPETITPYQNDGADANAAIDWISKQPWSNGSVGMLGGSYSGYAQWAAARYAHPALKTIVPAVAAIPGQGLPMENNIFLNANYAWAFYVANTRFLDNALYTDQARWRALNTRWFESGRPYREFDAVDGTPNPWLQEWLKHPSFDAYWQRNIPWQSDYANINIPVLSITGYFDDGQISALEYYREHLKHNPRANHTLLIGPWDHFGSQGRPSPVVNEYQVDAVALQPITDVIYQWLDHVLKGTKRPELLADKINYQLMGTNTWQHATSLRTAAPETLTFYLHSDQDKRGVLASKQAKPASSYVQTVDFADRKKQNNTAYYPWPIIRDDLESGDAPVFVSAPLTHDVDLVGTFSADLAVRINKRDVDIGLTLFEQMPDGRYFHLGYFLGRASYVKDPTTRQLLTPGNITQLPITKSRMTGRRLSAGSRIVLLADVNKNESAQVNYGTGRDVSDESIADASEPLIIEWLSDSALHLPVRTVR